MAKKITKKVQPKKSAPKKAKKVAKSPSSELNTAIAHIKISLEEVMDVYKRKQEARISALEQIVAAGKKGGAGKGKEIPKACGQKLSKKLSSLKVKPKKGRGKDLVKIEKLLEELMEHIPKES
jgi:hypothetical protein